MLLFDTSRWYCVWTRNSRVKHEEADAKMFTCIKYVNKSGFEKAVIHTINTDVVVLGWYYQAFIDCEIFIHLGCG